MPNLDALMKKMREQEEAVGADNALYNKKKREVEKTLHEYQQSTPYEIVHTNYLSSNDINKKSYYKHEDHPQLHSIATALIQNFDVIEQELRGIIDEQLSQFTKWPEKICKMGWKVFGLYGFGRKLEENTKQCPRTTALIESLLPQNELTTVGFSSLEPGAYIMPHAGYEGYSDNILRLHLGIVVPEPNEMCAMRVGNVTKKWKRGEVLIFDDFITHEAWNFSDQIRINLLMDIKYTEKDYILRRKGTRQHFYDINKNEGVDCVNADFSGGLRNLLSDIDSTITSKTHTWDDKL